MSRKRRRGQKQENHANDNINELTNTFNGESFDLKEKSVTYRNESQKEYMQALTEYPVVFGIGPAGTGKTYLAVAKAVEAFQKGEVKRIILCRPAVEAGENLGFLPGTANDKIDPYMRPFFDALMDMLKPGTLNGLRESQQIEIAPLAFMRGRTLNDAYVILDEAQNTTPTQMKMLLTRMGNNCKMIITGDQTQIDLPEGQKSGLIEAVGAMRNVEGVKIHEFNNGDVVRHPMIGRMIDALDSHEKSEKSVKSGIGPPNP